MSEKTEGVVPLLTATMAGWVLHLSLRGDGSAEEQNALTAIANGRATVIATDELQAKDERIAELTKALRGLMNAKHVSLGDLVYDVREREGQGWDGPAVVAWSNAVDAAAKAVASPLVWR